MVVMSEKPRLTLVQKIVLRITGQAHVGHRTRPGWRGHLPFYAFERPEHDLVVNYPYGYDERLDCPECSRTAKRHTHLPS